MTQATLEISGATKPDPALVAFQSYLQMKAPARVVVPFAKKIADSLVKMTPAPRILRDYARLLSLIKSVALIRHYRRCLDEDGNIVADVADYETVRELVSEMFVSTTSGATPDTRTLVNAVIELDKTRTPNHPITNTMLANHLKIGIVQASRRAKRAVKLGWLVNREQRKYHAADYAPGEPMPALEGLPILDVDRDDRVNTERVNDSSFQNGTVNRLTPLTDGSMTPPPRDVIEVT
jgi:hypothetical protein